MNLEVRVLDRDPAERGYGSSQPDIAANDRAFSNYRFAAKNGRIRIDRDITFDGGVTFDAHVPTSADI